MKKEQRWYATDGVARHKITGEVFTPEHVGWDMLGMLIDHDPGLIGGTFLDPSCGDGNLLLCVLKFKIAMLIPPHHALKSLYGIELMEDNVVRCRQRLIDCAVDNGADLEQCLMIVDSHTDTSYPRIVCHDFLTWDVEKWRPIDAFESGVISFDHTTPADQSKSSNSQDCTGHADEDGPVDRSSDSEGI